MARPLPKGAILPALRGHPSRGIIVFEKNRLAIGMVKDNGMTERCIDNLSDADGWVVGRNAALVSLRHPSALGLRLS